jgi:SAM-dependent methyltransferase
VPTREPVEFDRQAKRYREAVEESISFVGASLDFFTRAKADALLGVVADRLGPPAERDFLDVGCGPGETDPSVDYRVSTAGRAIPFDAESFDVCFAICVLHHVPRGDRAQLIGEMRRVCRPGGLIVMFEHNPLNPLTRRAVRGCDFDRDAELLSRREASRLLSEAGVEGLGGRYILFFTRESRLLRGIEGRLGWLPLGAQYAVFGQRP